MRDFGVERDGPGGRRPLGTESTMKSSSANDVAPSRPRLHVTEVGVQVVVMFGLLTALILVTGWWDSNFFSRFSMRSIVRDIAVWSLFALGQAVVIIAGGI